MKFDALADELREEHETRTRMPVLLLKALFTRPKRRLVLLIRLQEWLDEHGRSGAARFVSASIHRGFACMIPPSSRIGRGVNFPHPVGIVIGEGVHVGDRCVIYQNVTIGKRDIGPGAYPRLGRGVTLYAGAQVLGSVELADSVVVGALSLVLSDCAVPGATLVGIPARVLPSRPSTSLS